MLWLVEGKIGEWVKKKYITEVAVSVRLKLETLTLILNPQSTGLEFLIPHLILFLWLGLG